MKRLLMMIGAAAVVAAGANAASVTIDSVTQRWSWNNTIDITYTVTDAQTLTSTGNDVYMRLVFNATIGGNSYTIDGVNDICVELASRIKPAKKGLTQGEADLAAIRQMCKL